MCIFIHRITLYIYIYIYSINWVSGIYFKIYEITNPDNWVGGTRVGNYYLFLFFFYFVCFCLLLQLALEHFLPVLWRLDKESLKNLFDILAIFYNRNLSRPFFTSILDANWDCWLGNNILGFFCFLFFAADLLLASQSPSSQLQFSREIATIPSRLVRLPPSPPKPWQGLVKLSKIRLKIRQTPAQLWAYTISVLSSSCPLIIILAVFAIVLRLNGLTRN
ncbi:hypothetical protein CLU79DRAFT_97208 [Phycomyces nitens]|nr:hypothetical protein CLU79DRAFT_97208 [Phycomyces nitens]